jgi:type II secretory pathway pseudopilin PulG
MRRRESGFAMLFVLLMAGMVAITLYMALPRMAFESQRDKEQALMDAGGQYKRAVQLYVRQNKRWPAKIEDLESTNGKRYLRKRYVDPMTGKDEWRLVHVGPNGVLTDSLVKQPEKKQDGSGNNNLITDLGGVSAMPDGTPGPGNPGLRKRPSDSLPSGTGDGGQPGAAVPGGLPGTGNQPGTLPGAIQGTGPTAGNNVPGQGNYPPQGFVNGQATPTGLPQQLQGGNTFPGQQPVSSQNSGGITVLGGIGGSYSTAPGANGSALPPAQGGLQGTLQGQNTGVPPGGQPQPGANGVTPPGAAQLIQGLLTSPRPGGAPGSTFPSSSVGQVQGGGIAGFASKFEGEGIKVYNEQTEYQKWEFVYDMSKDTMVTGGQQAVPQPPGPNSTNGFGGSTPTGTTTATPTSAPAVIH